MDVEKQFKRTNTTHPYIETKHQEPVTTVSELKNAGPDSAAPIQEVQTETSMEKEKFETEQECSLFLPQSELNYNTSCDELTCLKPVQLSSLVSVSHVAKVDSAEKEPEQSTQGEELEQQKNLQSETIHESLSYDLQKHCKEFNMVTSMPELFVVVSTQYVKHFGLEKSINDESLAKLEMQQSNLGNCLAASFDIGAVRGSYLNNQRELTNKLAKVSDHVFKNSFITDCTDMMHLFLSKEPCADYDEALIHTRRKNKPEEDKRFKPPDLNPGRHQDITCFILIKEAPPDAAYKPKPSKNKFGIRLLLYDNFSCANLFCFSVYYGTSDPDDHIAQYRQRMLAVALPKESREATMCKGDKFVEQFASSRDLEKTLDGLYEILQHRAEPLRGYIARFNQEKVAIPEFNILTAIYAFKRGTAEERPKVVKPDQNERDERPSPRPTKDFGNRSRGRYQNRPIEKAEGMAVYTWPDISHLSISKLELVNVLRQMGQQVKWPQKMKVPDSFRNPGLWCDFHHDHGHKMEDCVPLRIEVNELLKKGHPWEFLSVKAKSHLSKETSGKPTKVFPTSPPRQDRVIHVISGGSEISGISHAAAKKRTWKAKHSLEAAKPKRMILGTDEINFIAKEQEKIEDGNEGLGFKIDRTRRVYEEMEDEKDERFRRYQTSGSDTT
ncbi:hypothetical protein F2Q70_00002791 [Brassica cretica]|uniref:Retrotransposon gag domain-containing protein n=1 Tax=Brassica cretica TaxID=69181 RepID=A0A8S9IN24_BRACR|nr:hypothetical protein F2Q70_00002791 [Brassica cretica]